MSSGRKLILVLTTLQLGLLALEGGAAILTPGFGALLAGYGTAILAVPFLLHGGAFLLAAVLAVRLRNRRILALELAIRRANDLTECSSDLVWEVDTSGRFTVVADHAHICERFLGLRSGASVIDLMNADPVTPQAVWLQQLEQNKAGEPFHDFRYSLPRADGGVAHISATGIPIFSKTGEPLGYRGTSRDITREVEATLALAHQALHDSLTGMPNRRALEQELDRVVGGAAACAAVLLLDLDGFKTVNDLHGHAAGDQLLRLVAGRLRTAVRGHDEERRPSGGDFTARLGGDEFAAVLTGCGSEHAEAVAQRIAASLAGPYRLEDGVTARIGVSVGIAMAPEHGTRPDEVLRCADLALYRTKNGGGSGACLYRPALHARPARAQTRAEAVPGQAPDLAAELDAALSNGEFSLAFQPVRRCDDGAVSIVEALLRWTSPTRGAVPPNLFLPAAEQSGLIVPIGVTVLRKACRAAQAAGGGWRIAVNLSPVQFNQPDLVPTVAGILKDTGLPADRLLLELTESVMLPQMASAREKLRKLRAMGVTLALDDFGTGFSNVTSLQEMRFDLIKIDRSVVAVGIERRERLLRAMLEIASIYGVPTVVEGVEHAEDWQLVRRLGSAHAQGYLLGRPVADLALALAPSPAAHPPAKPALAA